MKVLKNIAEVLKADGVTKTGGTGKCKLTFKCPQAYKDNVAMLTSFIS